MKVSRILLIDDDAISNKITEGVIKSANFADEIIIKTDGKQGIQYLLNTCNTMECLPDLILLDLKMPVMDAFDFLKHFEVFAKTIKDDIAVIILTGSRDPDDYVKLVKAGRYYTVNKPVTLVKLEDIYHRFFRNRAIHS